MEGTENSLGINSHKLAAVLRLTKHASARWLHIFVLVGRKFCLVYTLKYSSHQVWLTELNQ